MLQFDWDPGNISHLAKHDISPAEAEQVILNEPFDIGFDLRDGEERIAQIGETNTGRMLVVITTIRQERIRVVTAFPAKKRLRNFYLTQRKIRDRKNLSHEGKAQE
jgi:uncharacterized DUF497 family protein